MNPEIIVMLGDPALQPPWLDSLVRDAGYQFKPVSNLNDLRDLADAPIVAVFFNAKSLDLPWKDSIVWIHSIAPEAHCVVCHGFHEEIDWPSLSSWGAFHSLPLPFDPTEVRQAIGFIAMDKKHNTPPAPDISNSVSELG
jgi:hypothetical protein